MQYTCQITKTESDGKTFYDAEFPDIPNAFTCADTPEAIRDNAQDVLNAMLSAMLSERMPLPEARTKADPKKGLEAFQVENKLAVAYAIFEARRGRPAAEIARKMGITRQAYGRLEDPKASLTVATLEKFAKAVGKKLVIKFE